MQTPARKEMYPKNTLHENVKGWKENRAHLTIDEC